MCKAHRRCEHSGIQLLLLDAQPASLACSSFEHGRSDLGTGSFAIYEPNICGKVVEGRRGVDGVLPCSASPVPHAVKCAVLRLARCVQLQRLGNLLPTPVIYCAFWRRSCIIFLTMVAVLTFTKNGEKES